MTVEEFWDYDHDEANDGRALELWDGQVVDLYRPSFQRRVVCPLVAAELQRYADERQNGYACLGRSGVILSRTPPYVFGPDVAYHLDTRPFDLIECGWSESPPVLAVEVTSAVDKHPPLDEKAESYLRFGVTVVWVVDATTQAVTVYRLGQRPYVLARECALSGGTDLPGFACRVSDFFTLPGEREAA